MFNMDVSSSCYRIQATKQPSIKIRVPSLLTWRFSLYPFLLRIKEPWDQWNDGTWGIDDGRDHEQYGYNGLLLGGWVAMNLACSQKYWGTVVKIIP